MSPAEVEDVLNWMYDIGAALPTKTTEAHHIRRVVLQRQVLAARGLDPMRVLELGELYRSLSKQTAQLGVLASATRRRRTPMDINAGRGFVFVSHLGTVHPSGFSPLAPATSATPRCRRSTGTHSCSSRCATYTG